MATPVVLIPGDGIGPEVTSAMQEVLATSAAARATFGIIAVRILFLLVAGPVTSVVSVVRTGGLDAIGSDAPRLQVSPLRVLPEGHDRRASWIYRRT